MKDVLVGSAALVAVLAVTHGAFAGETTLDDFEGAGAPAPWVFSNGPEFPGATGSLTLGPGHTGHGAALAYDFAGGGSYVAATLTLTTPIDAAAIGYWVNAPAGIHAKLRVVDSAGQTLQYDVSRPLEASDASAWFREVVELDSPTGYFGGPDDGKVHGKITAVTILAADPIETGSSGVVDFDDVVAIDALAPVVDPSAATLVPPPPGSDSLATRLGVNIHFTQDGQALDIATAAGITRVRMDLGWSGIETTKGVYDFTAFDGLVSALAMRGMTLHMILDYANPLYPPIGDANFASQTVPAFAAVSKAAAAHFAGKGVTYEVWNEPNGTGFWPPMPDPVAYAGLCAATIAAVHQGDATAKISTGGLAGFDFPFLHGYLDAGGAVGADAVGIHPYRMTGGETATDELLLMRAIVAKALPAAPPVWDTEWGYSSTWFGGNGQDPTARATQADFAVRELLSAWALGFPLAVYYDMRDDGTDLANAEDNFGLIQNDYLDKPAIQAVRTLTKSAKNRTFKGFLPLEPSSLHAMELDGMDDTVVVVWSDAPGSSVPILTPKGVTGISMSGGSLTLTPQGGQLTYVAHDTDGPVYLTFSKSEPPDAGSGSGASGGGGAGTSSNNGGSGQTGSGGAGGKGGESNSSGCGCVVGNSDAPEAPWLTAAALAALALTRRRFSVSVR